MKIPTLKLPNVESKAMPTPYSSVNPDTGAGALAAGLGQAEQASDEIGRYRREAQRKANAMAVADAMAQYQQERTSHAYGSNSQRAGDTAFGDDQELPEKGGTDAGTDARKPLAPPVTSPPAEEEQRTNGYLNTRGKRAAAELDPALNDLQNARKRIGDGLANDEQKREFGRRSGELFQESYRQYHEHTAQQLKMAEEASQKANEAAALNSVANHFADPKEAAIQTQQISEQLRAFALSPEDAKGKVAAWEATVTETRLKQYLANHDYTGAQALFSSEGKRLGGDAQAHYGNIITKGREDVDAQAIAGAVMNEATDPKSGKVSYSVALAKLGEHLKKAPNKDPDFVKEATRAVHEAFANSEAAWEDTAKNVSREAMADFNSKGGWARMDPSLKDSLNKYNGELWNRLANEDKRKAREALMTLAELRRMQAEANTNLLYQFQSLPPEQRASTDIDVFAAGSGATQLGINAVKAHQRQTLDVLNKGEGEHEKSFVDRVESAFQGSVKTSKDAKDSPEGINTLRAEATNRYYAWKKAHDGKPPSDKEAEDIIVSMKKLEISRPGIFGTHIFEKSKPQYQVDAEARKKNQPAKGDPDEDLLFAPKPAAKPATAPTTIRLVGPKGQTGYSPPGKALDEFLSKNKGWKRAE